jgi:O-antigen ligase/Flp pilus assembly protein TadD
MELRPAVVIAFVVCLAAAAAPWFSGGQEPVALLISGMALLLAALLAWMQPAVRRYRPDLLAWSYLLIACVGTLSLLWSANRFSTGVWIVQWLLVGLAFRLAYVVAGEPRGREWMLRAYLVSAVIFCGVALWIYMTGIYPRLTGTFYWPNPAAAYLIPAILISLDRLRSSVGRAALVWAAAGGVFLVSFLLTDSRAAILALGLVLGVYGLVVPLRRANWTRLVFVVLVAVLGSILLTQLSTITAHRAEAAIPGSRFAEAAGGDSRSLKDRVMYLASAVHMWAAHPMLGNGAGTYGDIHPQYQQRVVSAASSAHNVYVQSLAELGLVGAAALGVALLALAGGIFRSLAREPRVLAVSLGLLGLLLHFGLDIDAHYPALLVLAAVLAGLIYMQREQARAGARWPWPALAAVLLVPLVSLYQSDTWAGSAKAAEADGDYQEAASRFALANRGVLYNPDNVSAEGIALYALASSMGPDAKASSGLALQRARQAERLDPHDGQHYQLEGRVLALQGNFSSAEAKFKQALAFDRFNHPEYALDLATMQSSEGNDGAALATAQAMIALYPPDVVANRNADATIRPSLANLEALAGNIYLKRGDLRAAGIAARRGLAQYPQSLRARALLNQVDKAAQMGGQ